MSLSPPPFPYASSWSLPYACNESTDGAPQLKNYNNDDNNQHQWLNTTTTTMVEHNDNTTDTMVEHNNVNDNDGINHDSEASSGTPGPHAGLVDRKDGRQSGRKRHGGPACEGQGTAFRSATEQGGEHVAPW